MSNEVPKLKLDRDTVSQLSPAQLVEVIVQQQLTIEKQQEIIEQLQQEIEKLKSSLKLDSRNSSKPPSTDHGNNPMLGQAFLALIDEAFTQHHQWCERPDLSSYQTWVLEFKQRLQQTIQQWIGKAGYEAGKLLRSLRDKAEQWWYFLDHPEVPPDNNLAERCLRLAVTKRKVSGGSRSLERFTQTANLLTVVQTCRLQGRSVVEFFQQAIVATSHKKDLQPSLLPTAHI